MMHTYFNRVRKYPRKMVKLTGNPVNFTILREKAILEGINGFAICAYHNCLSQIVQRTFTYQKISKILSV
jgi:hypothetical protein